MADVGTRLDELTAEAKRRGVYDLVHNYEVRGRIMALADLLGYDPALATDPEIPLTPARGR